MRQITPKTTRGWRILLCLLLCWPALLAAEEEKISLRVGYLPILDHLPLLVSHARENTEFFRINITPRLFKSWGAMVGALRADVIDAAFILSPLAMDLFNHGEPLRGVLLAHRNGSAITVKKGLGIHSAADLKGKTIAIPALRATHTALLDHYLRSAGLSLEQISPRVIAPPLMLTAMQHQHIDAFIVAEPFGVRARQTGIGETLVLTKDILPNHVECIVVVKQAMLQQFPEAIEQWIGSLVRAGKFIDRDKAENGAREVARLTSKRYLPHDRETIMAGLQYPVDKIYFSDLNPAAGDFQAIVEISRRAGILQETDLDAFIDRRFYDAAILRESAGEQP